EEYEKLMLKAAKLDPVCYYSLGDYFIERHEEDRGAPYIDKACATDPDSVRVSDHAVWRVRYCLEKGQTNKASEIAAQAAEVYSYTGLEAEAIFLEATTNYDGAFGYYSKIEERYDDSIPLLCFCTRYQVQTGDQRFAPEIQKRIHKMFPKGIEKVSLADFHGPPADGVLIQEENRRVRAAGLKAGNVIVAVYGVRVHNFQQYTYGRELKKTPELDLIVWQGDAYREFKPSLTNHLFGVTFGDYPQISPETR
ncbi:MAG TPA: hypothetical protein VKA67_10025, partial [Verrucomicrobiae bacterium]|nr:hypothetical protein [Verrucomicrobiae bacterium]